MRTRMSSAKRPFPVGAGIGGFVRFLLSSNIINSYSCGGGNGFDLYGRTISGFSRKAADGFRSGFYGQEDSFVLQRERTFYEIRMSLMLVELATFFDHVYLIVASVL